ncbi:hypothetical protein BDN70DRAFT_108463 [Pholiota conissans]|uniref:Uncharacterized protein n=1 Tax=Pholiota conissans TaxID=109636 RepID=A0A9P5YXA1_9AGAR|nr:hypothetical protein BDN70DRAFT_108463 [Pholiota conissans]
MCARRRINATSQPHTSRPEGITSTPVRTRRVATHNSKNIHIRAPATHPSTRQIPASACIDRHLHPSVTYTPYDLCSSRECTLSCVSFRVSLQHTPAVATLLRSHLASITDCHFLRHPSTSHSVLSSPSSIHHPSSNRIITPSKLNKDAC